MCGCNGCTLLLVFWTIDGLDMSAISLLLSNQFDDFNRSNASNRNAEVNSRSLFASSSKELPNKFPKGRRVRLSASTACQTYDLRWIFYEYLCIWRRRYERKRENEQVKGDVCSVAKLGENVPILHSTISAHTHFWHFNLRPLVGWQLTGRMRNKYGETSRQSIRPQQQW